MPTLVQYAASTVVSRADGEAAALACSSAAAVAGSSAASATQKPKPSCTVTSSRSLVTRSCSRGPGPGGSVSPTMPGSAPSSASASAWVRTAARSRDGSPNWCCTCSPSHTSPSSRSMAGAAIGSSVHRVTARSVPSIVSGAVADGHQLAQGHQVALGRQALERPGDVRAHATRRAVAALVPLARPARARLARADLPLGEGSGRRALLGTGLLGHAGATYRGAAPRFVCAPEREKSHGSADESGFSRRRRAGRGRTGGGR